jgi:hypothetical protein
MPAEETVDIDRILAELRAERDRLDKAIAALAGINSTGRTTRTAAKAARRGRMSAAARKRLSQLLKQRWASGKMGRRRRAKAA